jgi:hypothetical protein
MKWKLFGPKRLSAADFWKEFAAQSARFEADVRAGKLREVAGKVADLINRYSEGHGFRIIPPQEGALIRLEISPDIDLTRVQKCKELAAAFPGLSGWEVFPYRQPIAGFRTPCSGRWFTARDVRCFWRMQENGDRLLMLFAEGVTDANEAEWWGDLVELAINTLGEEDVMTLFQQISVLDMSSAPEAAFFLADARQYIK